MFDFRGFFLARAVDPFLREGIRRVKPGIHFCLVLELGWNFRALSWRCSGSIHRGRWRDLVPVCGRVLGLRCSELERRFPGVQDRLGVVSELLSEGGHYNPLARLEITVSTPLRG